MNEQRQHALAGRGVAPHPLAGAGLALDDGVDDFEVGRIGGEADLDGLSVAVAAAYLTELPLAPLWTLGLWGGSVALAGRLLVQREADMIEALEN